MKSIILFAITVVWGGTLLFSENLVVWSQEQAKQASFAFDEQTKDAIILMDGDLPLWQYNFGFIEHDNVPPSDPRRFAGCYVHPLYGLNGEVLTENAPADHYHHHGVFWTWPHVLVHQEDGKTDHYDLWTSNTPIRQHFVKWLSRSIEDNQAVLAVENGWFVGPVERDENGNVVKGEKVMQETVQIRTGPLKTVEGVQGRFLDFEFLWVPTSRAISLRGAEDKSYGGFSVRFRPTGKKEVDTKITAPAFQEGRSENADLLEAPLPWADFSARYKNEGQMSGTTIFIPKDHPNYPPTWLTRYYGAMCVGWPGVVEQTFQPNQKIRLHYRLWVHDDLVKQDVIEKVYQQVGSLPLHSL